jgi:hypothetical protein
MSSRDGNRLMGPLRTVEGCTKQDHFTNEEYFRKKLRAESTVQEVIHYRQEWKLHTVRISNERIAKQLLVIIRQPKKYRSTGFTLEEMDAGMRPGEAEHNARRRRGKRKNKVYAYTYYFVFTYFARVEPSPLLVRPLTCLLYQHWMIDDDDDDDDDDYGATGGRNDWQGKPKCSEKPCPSTAFSTTKPATNHLRFRNSCSLLVGLPHSSAVSWYLISSRVGSRDSGFGTCKHRRSQA